MNHQEYIYFQTQLTTVVLQTSLLSSEACNPLYDVLTEYGTQGSITQKEINIPLLSKSSRVQRC